LPKIPCTTIFAGIAALLDEGKMPEHRKRMPLHFATRTSFYCWEWIFVSSGASCGGSEGFIACCDNTPMTASGEKRAEYLLEHWSRCERRMPGRGWL